MSKKANLGGEVSKPGQKHRLINDYDTDRANF